MKEKSDVFIPHLPEVDIRPDIESVFKKARKEAGVSREDEEGLYHRQVIIITPGRLLISKLSPLPSEIFTEELERLPKLIAPQPPQNIAVIAYTYIEALKKDILQAIPFFGYLLGFSAIGHRVWIFEGHPSALRAGCRKADILLVDSMMLPFLERETDWRASALETMAGNEIKVIAR